MFAGKTNNQYLRKLDTRTNKCILLTQSLYRQLTAFDKRQTVNISSFLKFVRIWALIFFGTTCLGLAQEDPKVTLVANEIFFTEGGKVSTAGNVKITYGNTLVQASRVEFDDNNYTFHGPIYISDPSGTRAVAEFTSLSQEEQTGVIEGLRILYRNRLQITSGTVKREDGSLVLFNNLITTCSVCTAGETPLWYFQADSITVKEGESRIYLKNVRFKIWDVPVLYFPWFSIGSPVAGRQSGFLIPEVKYKSGTGIETKIPYYLVLNDQTDLTLSFGRTPAKKPGYNLEFRNNSKSGWIFFEAAYPFREENLGLFKKDLVLKGVQRPDETSQISFLVTDTSSDNTSYPAGIFPDGNKLTFVEAKKSFPIGELTFRTINVSPIKTVQPAKVDESDDEESDRKLNLADNSFERLISLGFKTNDLMPNSRPSLTFDLKFNSTSQNPDKGPEVDTGGGTIRVDPKYHDFKNASVLGRYSDTIIFNSGLKSSTTIFLHGEAYDQDITDDSPELKKRVNYGRTLIVNNLSFPLVLSGVSNHQMLTPFIQTVYSKDNNKTLPLRPSPLQVIDRSKFLANHQEIAESWVRDGREVSLGLKYFTSFQDNKFDFIFGKTILKPADKAESKPDYIHGGDQKSHYFAEGILELGDNIEITSLSVADNKFRMVSNYSQLSLLKNGYEAGISYGWIKGNVEIKADDEEDNKVVERVISKSANSYLNIPLSDQWTGFGNVEYDFLGHAKREFELGAIYHHQCVTFEISAKRTLETVMANKTKPDYSIGFSLVGFTSASTLSRKNCN